MIGDSRIISRLSNTTPADAVAGMLAGGEPGVLATAVGAGADTAGGELGALADALEIVAGTVVLLVAAGGDADVAGDTEVTGVGALALALEDGGGMEAPVVDMEKFLNASPTFSSTFPTPSMIEFPPLFHVCGTPGLEIGDLVAIRSKTSGPSQQDKTNKKTNFQILLLFQNRKRNKLAARRPMIRFTLSVTRSPRKSKLMLMFRLLFTNIINQTDRTIPVEKPKKDLILPSVFRWASVKKKATTREPSVVHPNNTVCSFRVTIIARAAIPTKRYGINGG